MSDTVQEFLLNFGPAITILCSMLGYVAVVMKHLRSLLSKSNIDEVRAQFEKDKEDIAHNIEELVVLCRQLIQENADLKAKQSKLLESITRVKE